MDILVLYFSGTGNTEYVSRYLATALQTLDPDSQVIRKPIEAFVALDLENIGLLCLGFPIYALRAPSIVSNFIQQLPKVENMGLFLFCTMGFGAGNALLKINRRMKKKGFRHVASTKVMMPGSDGLGMMSVDARYVRKAENKDYDHLPKVDRAIEQIKQAIEETQLSPDNTFTPRIMKINIIDVLFGWIFTLFYHIFEKWMKQKYWADESCIQCNLCGQICPTLNIQLIREQIQFDDSCIVCLRCLHQCPTAAIQIGSFTKGKYRWHGPKGDFHPPKHQPA